MTFDVLFGPRALACVAAGPPGRRRPDAVRANRSALFAARRGAASVGGQHRTRTQYLQRVRVLVDQTLCDLGRQVVQT